MPKFLENPSLLTKDQLKSDLKTHGVDLPKGDQRKQVYVNLYLKHLTSQNKSQNNGILGFSSDEEEDDKPSPKKPPQRPQKALIRKPVKGLPYDVNSLSDGDLARQLRNYGQVVGPITETTRPLYQKKLIKLLQEEMKNPASVQPANTTPKAWEYSDNEEENQVSNRTFEVKKKQEVVDIPDDEDDDDDDVDASPEPPRQLTHQTKDRPRPPRESTPKKVIKRETVVSESHMETRKRVFESDKKTPEETAVSKSSSAFKTTKMSDSATVSKSSSGAFKTTKMSDSAKSGSSWEWKAVLVVLAIITTILLVYYFMEEPPPFISKQ